MKTIIIGKSGCGKTTLYRQLNEKNICNAVELELPPSCIEDDDIKEKLFKTYYNSYNIDTIIVHWKFLPYQFLNIINKEDKIYYLNVSDDVRKIRLYKRGLLDDLDNSNFFNKEYFNQEEAYMNIWLERFKDNKTPLSKWTRHH